MFNAAAGTAIEPESVAAEAIDDSSGMAVVRLAVMLDAAAIDDAKAIDVLSAGVRLA